MQKQGVTEADGSAQKENLDGDSQPDSGSCGT